MKRIVLGLLCGVLLRTATAQAASIGLAWDPVTTNVDGSAAGVTGYRVYRGLASRNYSTAADVGGATNCSFVSTGMVNGVATWLSPGMSAGITPTNKTWWLTWGSVATNTGVPYYFAVTAVDTSQWCESAYSVELVWTTPAPSVVRYELLWGTISGALNNAVVLTSVTPRAEFAINSFPRTVVWYRLRAVLSDNTALLHATTAAINLKVSAPVGRPRFFASP